MRSRKRLAIFLLAIFPAIAVAVGCSHTDLEEGTQALSIDLTPSPGGAGRYERAQFTIKTIEAIPTDPNTGSIYGASDTLLFNFDHNYIADLTLANPSHYSSIALSTGGYRIVNLIISPPNLIDTDDLPPNPPTCIEGIAVLQGGSAPGMPTEFVFTNPPELTFTISPGQSVLPIRVNVPGLVAGYENAFTCQLGCGPGGSPCLTAFDQAAFRAAFLANVSFQ
jgi:hypothetical protein